MKKRQIKKNSKKILNTLEAFVANCEELEKLNVISVDYFRGIVDCFFLTEDLLKLPFVQKSNIDVIDLKDSYRPFEFVLYQSGVKFSSLASIEQVRKYFPEKIKKSENYIEIAGVKYLKESVN
ncbi:hypothetical protein [Enterococcus hirae]|uniref:hypothetical protein n=1 Tax=Enterococcus hirae TaxID=1354 RepID=UPI003848C284